MLEISVCSQSLLLETSSSGMPYLWWTISGTRERQLDVFDRRGMHAGQGRDGRIYVVVIGVERGSHL